MAKKSGFVKAVHRLHAKFKKARAVERGKRKWLSTLLAGGIGFFLTLGFSVFGLWHLSFLAPFDVHVVDPSHHLGVWFFTAWLWLLHTAFGHDTLLQYQWGQVDAWLYATGTLGRMNALMDLSLFFALLVSLGLGFRVGRGKPLVSHLSGQQLHDDDTLAAHSTDSERAVSGEGIRIHPKVAISRDRETRHIMILGSIGSGKTQTIRNILQSILARFKKGPADRLIIYDNKSDVTKGLPVDDKEIILLAPWDQRTWAWDVAKDILNDVDATEICKRLIPPSDGDPFWAMAAQALLVAVFTKLQRERGTDWSWKDINSELSDPYKLAETVQKYQPSMQSLMEDVTSKTAQSVLTTLATFTATIRLLTQAWDNVDPITGTTYEEGRIIPKISLREWSLTPIVERRVIIMQGNKRYSSLEKAYIQSIISAFGAIMNSPEMTDDPNRRIWFLLDELPQLGKLENFAQYLEVGRSKGMCIIMGLQDLAQLREIYKRETAAVWESICGTFVICRSGGVDTVEWLKKFFGERQIVRWSRSRGKGGESLSEHVEKEELVKLQDVQALGPGPEGITALLALNNGTGVFRLIWPYVSFKDVRPAQIQAGWTRYVAVSQVEADIQNQLTTAFSHVFSKGFDEPESGANPALPEGHRDSAEDLWAGMPAGRVPERVPVAQRGHPLTIPEEAPDENAPYDPWGAPIRAGDEEDDGSDGFAAPFVPEEEDGRPEDTQPPAEKKVVGTPLTLGRKTGGKL